MAGAQGAKEKERIKRKMAKKIILLPLGLIALGIFCFFLPAEAATKTWNGLAGGMASVAANWSPVGVPIAGDDVVFNSTSNRNCTWNITPVLNSFSISSGYTRIVTLAAGLNTGNLTVASGTLNALSYAINVSGNWDSSTGTFSRGTSIVTLTGTGTVKQRTTGNPSNYGFYRLICAAGGWTTTISSNQLWVDYLTVGSGTLTGATTLYLQGSGDVFTDGGATITVTELVYRASQNVSQNVVGRNYTGITTLYFRGLGGASGDSTYNMQGDVITNDIQIYTNNSSGNTNTAVLNTNGYNLTAASLRVGRASYIYQYGRLNAGSSAIDINGSVTINPSDVSGANEINAQSSVWTVSRNWANNDTFTAGASNVIFDGNTPSVISGANTFYKLSCLSAGKTLSFASGTTQAITNNLTFNGAGGSPVTLSRSGGAGSNQWYINLQTGATQSVSYVAVSNSNASGNKIIAGTTSTNGGNNTNWVFNPQLVFTTPIQSIIQDEASSLITVELQDENSNAVNVSANTAISLSSSSSGGSFSVDKLTWGASSVTILAGFSGASFYYKDSQVSSPTATITASESPDAGWVDATQPITVNSSASAFRVEASSLQVAGSSFSLKVTALDNGGNPATSFSATVDLAVNYISPSSGTGAFSVTRIQPSDFINGVAAITNETFSDCGTIAITAVDLDDSTRTGISANIDFRPYDFTVVVSGLDASGQHTVNKPFALTITARNTQGNTCPNYQGTANLSINYISPATGQSGSLGIGSLTASYWSDGMVTLTGQTYNKWGAISVTASDAILTNQSGASDSILFLPKDFSIILANPPASRTYYYTNENFSATVTARDYNDNAISNYAGAITFTGSGLNLPPNYTFTGADSGSHKFEGINGNSPRTTVLSVKDTVYLSVAGSSPGITVKSGSIKVVSTAGPVGLLGVEVKILDANGNLLNEDNSTTFIISIVEAMEDNNSCTSLNTSIPAIVTDGIAKIMLRDTEAETATVTPFSTPSLSALSGTIRFGTVSGAGINIPLWREMREPIAEEGKE